MAVWSAKTSNNWWALCANLSGLQWNHNFGAKLNFSRQQSPWNSNSWFLFALIRFQFEIPSGHAFIFVPDKRPFVLLLARKIFSFFELQGQPDAHPLAKEVKVRKIRVAAVFRWLFARPPFHLHPQKRNKTTDKDVPSRRKGRRWAFRLRLPFAPVRVSRLLTFNPNPGLREMTKWKWISLTADSLNFPKIMQISYM
jgi:hypothetical protein